MVKSESAVTSEIMIESSQKGVTLWRNNVCVLTNKQGTPVRCGLANDSKSLNKNFKSSDLIGIKPVLITREMVGTIIGQFVAREIKRENWVYGKSQREIAQLKFLEFVAIRGGDAAFATGVGTL